MAKVFNAADIEVAIASLAKQPGSGLIVAPDTFSEINGDLIVTLAAEHRVPAVYAIRRFAMRGGLMSYGPNSTERSSARHRTSLASCAAKSPATCRWSRRQVPLIVNIKAAKRSASRCRNRLLRADEVIE